MTESLIRDHGMLTAGLHLYILATFHMGIKRIISKTLTLSLTP